MSDIPTLYCANHPDVETGLRCKECDKPICPKCAVLTPTGYSCKACMRKQQKVFETASPYDPVIAFLVALVLTLLGAFVVSILPWAILTIFVAPVAGVFIAEAVRRAVQRRRSKRLFQAAVAGAVIGVLPFLLGAIFTSFVYGFMAGLWGLIWQGYYAFSVVSAILYRLRGIRIG